MYNILKNVINRGEYDLSSIVSKTDKLWAEDKITEEQRDELLEMARSGAHPGNSIDVLAKLVELESRIKILEEGGTDTTEEIDDYIAGKWYYRGNKMRFNGDVFVCDAPEGVVCVWSPDEYPSYWKKE